MRQGYVRVLCFEDVSAAEVVVCLEVHSERVEEIQHGLQSAEEVAVAGSGLSLQARRDGSETLEYVHRIVDHDEVAEILFVVSVSVEDEELIALGLGQVHPHQDVGLSKLLGDLQKREAGRGLLRHAVRVVDDDHVVHASLLRPN